MRYMCTCVYILSDSEIGIEEGKVLRCRAEAL